MSPWKWQQTKQNNHKYLLSLQKKKNESLSPTQGWMRWMCVMLAEVKKHFA